MSAVPKIIPFPRKEIIRRNESELAFLPAALEVVETPPSPIGRAIGITVIALFVVAVIWAVFGTVDIVATSPGKIIPSGRTKTIQPFESGVVSAIRVRDGQSVKAGDVLIELDPTMTEAERDHLKSDYISAELELARLRAALSEKAQPIEDFRPPDGASPSLIEMNKNYLLSQLEEYKGKLAALDRQLKQKEAERDTISAAVGKIEATLPILTQKVEIRKTLLEKNLVSKIVYLTEYQDLVGMQQDLLLQKSRYQEADAALAALAETRSQSVAEYRRTRFEELAKAEQKAAGLANDLIKANQRTKLQVLTSPVDGVVQQLAVHTIGGVVSPGQALLTVVPSDSHLEIEAMVANRDIGFVHAGQAAEIKIDTFNFTRYGILHGAVLHVSQDAIASDKPQDGNPAANPSDGTSEVKAQRMNYAARVSLERTKMQVDERLVDLSPGMAVTVEIKTGSRRIIGYLLSPLAQYRNEALRER
jgi:membrane fusion protein, hemolysin D